MNTYSVSFRLRRVTTEVAYVSVSITDDLLRPADAGRRRLDAEKMSQLAIEQGGRSSTDWKPEGVVIELHPIQTAPSNTD
jgi:hypothetical protein